MSHPGRVELPEGLSAVSLSEVPGGLALMRRVDRKYVMPTVDAGELVRDLADSLVVVEASDVRWQRYRTLYFDTATRHTVIAALNRRRRRCKIRVREYRDADLAMLEVKDRTGRRLVEKHRRVVDVDDTRALQLGAPLPPQWREFVDTRVSGRLDAAALVAGMVVDFDRVTLIDAHETVRLTIDAAVECRVAGERSVVLPGLSVVETKTTGSPSAVDSWLWRRGRRPESFSKYVTGWVALDRSLPPRRYARSMLNLVVHGG